MLRHRPHGVEHPYATSPDQRVPVLPEVGERVRLGVEAESDVVAVSCEWVAQPMDDPAVSETRSLALERVAVSAADAAALAGGDGHLAAAQARAAGGDGGWEVTTPELEAGTRYRYRFHARTGDGRQASSDWHELVPAEWVSGAGTLTVDDAFHRLVDGSVEWLVADGWVHRARFAMRLEPDEHVVGFGERFDAVDQRGRELDAVVFEQYKAQGRHGRTYLPMPFAHVISETGDAWGFHVRTSRRTWFDVGASTPDRLVVEVALDEPADGPPAPAPATPSVDVAVYRGAPHEVLAAFTAEVGRAEELPDWVFRLWASGNEWNTQHAVMERMDRHRELDIPVGAVVVEAWSDEQTFTIFRDAMYEPHRDGSPHDASDFTYPPDGAWPDPKGMIDELHARGIRVLLWQIPLVKTRYELGDDVGDDAQVIRDGEAMVRDGHAVLEADGTPYHNRGWWFPQALMPDLSVERTRQWWAEKRRYLVSGLDVDGFKTDGGEHAWGHDLRYADGRRGNEGNNLYPVHYARTFGDLLRSEGKAPVTFSRAGFTGSQAHGLFWAGDEDSTWEAFRSSVIAGITASACGIVYWGWDLAGFSGEVPDAELYLRAAGAACFMPIMQYHSEFNHHRRPLRDRTPWNVAEQRGDERVVPVFRQLAHLRERLVGYLAEQAAVAIRDGRPLMRGLFFDHPDDPMIWRYPLQYQLGDALLVVPVIEPGIDEVAAYLPEGQWVDVWRGTNYTGPAEITLPAPIDQPPALCRAVDWPRLSSVFVQAQPNPAGTATTAESGSGESPPSRGG
ncbi:glycoside hydrolase family 31 [Actinobacteria bacterium YIM 96077]|uniref:Glycoside hydrolase family 31 n=1 Tax=Phytoactinopolyspora halophila TaxID=1981511 RepID=A0A329R786_9ACTN|nr:glycoside hydrolase family 31 [Actinobacteria bacterium YIM 96077]RAW18958.1 glycoside hydrolase family 31 [Phytoactinopolyspora halophila]